MILKLKKILQLALITLTLTACATTENNKEKKPDILDIYGIRDGGEYINKYYGFKLDIPESYTFQDDETKKYILELGAKYVYEDEETAESLEKLAEEQLFNILIATKYELGSPVPENIAFQIISENLTYYPGVKNGSDYLWHVQKQLKDSRINLINESEFLTEEINGINFHTYSYSMSVQLITINQKWYTKKAGNHVLCFALTSITEPGYNELKDIMYSIELLDNTIIE